MRHAGGRLHRRRKRTLEECPGRPRSCRSTEVLRQSEMASWKREHWRGALKNGQDSLPAGDPEGEACWGERQQDKGTDREALGGSGSGSSCNVRMRSNRRGWKGRSEPAPEALRSHAEWFDEQEGAAAGS